ncbi:hypothetical protein [Brevundimonas sp. NIBR11]|uniref:hypothetical protein n=1 Tax=Brevundimonas sp. NIBR11 TaxID=3015999 RepID=UPI0022F0CCA1|nr:hypothetical protein [Brevundimonas sp. NIBR11]WGM32448.1 hypothetical protein KKHFBJBL_02700 [Brevundimonas sp. NIBR11]
MAVTRYLAVFTSDKTGPRWAAWRAMTPEQQDETAARGVAAVKAWEEAHKDDILYVGGPLGPTKRIGADGAVEDIVNLLTVFMVVKAESHEAAVRLFDGHPHMSIFVCDGVEVMPVLGD